MARKKKEIDKNGPFQTRLRDLYTKDGRTHEALATLLDVSRPTFTGWLDGNSVPDILILEKMARLFGVSADYLLGLSDTAVPDVTARAAVEYTGLSVEAVEQLHNGLDDFDYDDTGDTKDKKERNLNIASALIQSEFFARIVHNLSKVAKNAYLERTLMILDSQYFPLDSEKKNPDFHFASEEERNVVKSNLLHVFNTIDPRGEELFSYAVWAMDDGALSTNVYGSLIKTLESNQLHQFHATKAFTAYLDQLIQDNYKRAEDRFKVK
ncbi:MAG: helix-turn-helix transcriptional regulator [Bacillota bacterium]|nr:helix-turn-helix transcriptional regulator [Bacillota bacterium]